MNTTTRFDHIIRHVLDEHPETQQPSRRAPRVAAAVEHAPRKVQVAVPRKTRFSRVVELVTRAADAPRTAPLPPRGSRP